MIERKFVAEKIKEYLIQDYISKTLSNVGHSHTKVQKTPLGEKIIIFASRPGLIVGKKGENIKRLTKTLKKKFNLENPQIEISEIENPNLDANIVAERIASTMERFGSQKFKGVCHKMMTDVLEAGAVWIEIIISGKVPSSRAKSWRFFTGYLKKCGDLATDGMLKAYSRAKLKTGIIGIQVRIMPKNLKMPDVVTVNGEEPKEAAAQKEKQPEKTAEKKEEHKKKTPRTRRKKAADSGDKK